jgi:hypothetical protein
MMMTRLLQQEQQQDGRGEDQQQEEQEHVDSKEQATLLSRKREVPRISTPVVPSPSSGMNARHDHDSSPLRPSIKHTEAVPVEEKQNKMKTKNLLEHVFDNVEEQYQVNHFHSPVELAAFVLSAVFTDSSFKEPNMTAVQAVLQRYPGALLLYIRRSGHEPEGYTNSNLQNDTGNYIPILNQLCYHCKSPIFIVTMLQNAYKALGIENYQDGMVLLHSLINDNTRREEIPILPTSLIIDILIERKDTTFSEVVTRLLLLKEEEQLEETKYKKVKVSDDSNRQLISHKPSLSHNSKQHEEQEQDLKGEQKQQPLPNIEKMSRMKQLRSIISNNLFEKAATKGHTETLITLLELNPHLIFRKNSDTYYMPLQNTVLDFRYETNTVNYLPENEWSERIAFLLDEGIKYSIKYHSSAYLLGGLFAVESHIDGFFEESIHLLGSDTFWKMLTCCLTKYSYYDVPILHAAIGKVYNDSLKGIMKHFKSSAFETDRDGKLALHVALEKGINWTQGLSDIVHANPMAVKEVEIRSGLPAYALAAVTSGSPDKEEHHHKTDLNTIYELSKHSLPYIWKIT